MSVCSLNIVLHDCNISLRETCMTTAQKHFPLKWKEKRVEFVPIEWRTWLTLDQGSLLF